MRRDSRPRSGLPAFLRPGRVHVVAHRGGGGLAPENTLPAFANAVARGVDAVELDVHATADGVVVAAHDDTVERVSDGEGPIRDFSFGALRELDAGHAFSSDGGQSHPFRGQGVRFPSLEEVCRHVSDVGLSVELKRPEIEFADAILELIRDLKLESRICVGSFHHAPIARLRARAPDVATSATQREVRRFHVLGSLGLSRWIRDGADVYAVPEVGSGRRVVTPKSIRVLHQSKRTVHVWTVNDTEDMRRLIAWGVDGLITDRPDLAMEARAAAGASNRSDGGRGSAFLRLPHEEERHQDTAER